MTAECSSCAVSSEERPLIMIIDRGQQKYLCPKCLSYLMEGGSAE